MACPPLDGSILFKEIPDFHLQHNPTNSFFVYAEDGGDNVRHITFLEFGRAVHRAAFAVSSLGMTPGPVALLALTDVPTYDALFFGLMKAGFVV
jgi:acyl-CoA synthetase (AMP-forming)/AMP-acid ligase II